MKLIKSFIHHVRAPEVIQALSEAGFRRISLLESKGMLRAVSETEMDFTLEAGGLLVAEAQLELVCDDHEVEAVTAIIRTHARIGPQISGWVYVSTVDEVLPIGETSP
jgi:nitrogen regulatory protein P-II 1